MRTLSQSEPGIVCNTSRMFPAIISSLHPGPYISPTLFFIFTFKIVLCNFIIAMDALSLQNSCVEIQTPQCDGIWTWGLWEMIQL